MMTRAAYLAAIVCAAALSLGPASAQDADAGVTGSIEPVSGFTGQMSMTMEAPMPEDMAVTEVIRFEPWQMLDELFRDDIVFLMRSGPSDWSTEDAADADSMDCKAQRLLTAAGRDEMRQLGSLLVANELRPGKVLSSHWCRAQQTYVALETGMVNADMDALDGMEADLHHGLDPVGEAAGQPDASGLRDIVLSWDGGDGDGPLLVITHFTNIEALTRFRVYEGEMLMVDPKRDPENGGRVLGYLRLGSATPDPVRFDPSVVTADVEFMND